MSKGWSGIAGRRDRLVEPYEGESSCLEGQDAIDDAETGGAGGLVYMREDHVAVVGCGDPAGRRLAAKPGAAIGGDRVSGETESEA